MIQAKMILGITMRMERKLYPNGASEMRDALACDWPLFLSRALPGCVYVFLPNIGDPIAAYAESLGINALLFTGGDDLGIFPPRDQTERKLFAWAYARQMPMLGVCRGAQILNLFLGGSLIPCQGHVAVRHGIFLRDNPQRQLEVNSFHGQCIQPADLAPGLTAFATTAEGHVEGFFGRRGSICGLMWHPEREREPAEFDLELFRNCLEGASHV